MAMKSREVNGALERLWAAGKVTRTGYNLARNVRWLRLRYGLSAAEAASRARISYPTWRTIEAGTRWPSAEVLERVAEVLHVSPGVLLLPPGRS